VSIICLFTQLCFKSAAETSECKGQVARTVSGSEFQIERPEVAKLRDPYRAAAPVDCVELSDSDGQQNGEFL